MLVHTHSSIPLSLNHMCIHTPQQMHTHTTTTITTTTLTMQHMFIHKHAHTLFSFTSHTWHLFLKSTKTAGRGWRMGETYPSWSNIEPTVFLLAFFSMKDLWTTSHIHLECQRFMTIFPSIFHHFCYCLQMATLSRKTKKHKMLMIRALFSKLQRTCS